MSRRYETSSHTSWEDRQGPAGMGQRHGGEPGRRGSEAERRLTNQEVEVRFWVQGPGSDGGRPSRPHTDWHSAEQLLSPNVAKPTFPGADQAAVYQTQGAGISPAVPGGSLPPPLARHPADPSPSCAQREMDRRPTRPSAAPAAATGWGDQPTRLTGSRWAPGLGNGLPPAARPNLLETLRVRPGSGGRRAPARSRRCGHACVGGPLRSAAHGTAPRRHAEGTSEGTEPGRQLESRPVGA